MPARSPPSSRAADADALSTALLFAADLAERNYRRDAGIEQILTVDRRGRLSRVRVTLS